MKQKKYKPKCKVGDVVLMDLEHWKGLVGVILEAETPTTTEGVIVYKIIVQSHPYIGWYTDAAIQKKIYGKKNL